MSKASARPDLQIDVPSLSAAKVATICLILELVACGADNASGGGVPALRPPSVASRAIAGAAAGSGGAADARATPVSSMSGRTVLPPSGAGSPMGPMPVAGADAGTNHAMGPMPVAGADAGTNHAVGGISGGGTVALHPDSPAAGTSGFAAAGTPAPVGPPLATPVTCELPDGTIYTCATQGANTQLQWKGAYPDSRGYPWPDVEGYVGCSGSGDNPPLCVNGQTCTAIYKNPITRGPASVYREDGLCHALPVSPQPILSFTAAIPVTPKTTCAVGQIVPRELSDGDLGCMSVASLQQYGCEAVHFDNLTYTTIDAGYSTLYRAHALGTYGEIRSTVEQAAFLLFSLDESANARTIYACSAVPDSSWAGSCSRRVDLVADGGELYCARNITRRNSELSCLGLTKDYYTVSSVRVYSVCTRDGHPI
jgi:hypothetical protein